MEFNQGRAVAAEVYLVENWHKHTGSPEERRGKIFQEFVDLGLRGRWRWHTRAEHFTINKDEEHIVESRPPWIRSIAEWLGQDSRRVIVSAQKLTMNQQEIDLRTGSGDLDYTCDEWSGNPYHILPELVYSMTAFNDPDDVEEARKVHDQSLWVSGVYWIDDKLVWVDEYGTTIREKVVPLAELEEGEKDFARAGYDHDPFDSKWWTEAIKVGKYAEDEWWK